jgi:hypothetical protein
MSPSSLPILRSTLALLLKHEGAERFPLNLMLEGLRHEPRPDVAPDDDQSVRDVLGALAPLEALVEQLVALGLSDLEQAQAPLRLAAFIDGLDPKEGAREPASIVAEVQRRLLRCSGEPLAQAVALLGGFERRRALMGRPEAVDLARAIGASLAERSPEAMTSVVGELMASLDRRLRKLQMAELLGPRREAGLADELLGPLDRARSLGRRSISFDRRCREAWEIQRSGLLGRDELEGDLFVPLLVLELGARAGLDVAEPLRQVVAPRLEQGLRYYRDLPQMPNDVDDAAELLILSRLVPEVVPELLLKQARMIISLGRQPGGDLATWVELPGEPTGWNKERWFGPSCLGVTARALRAAALDGLWTTAQLIESVEGLVAGRDRDGGYTGVHYPSRIATTALVVMALVEVSRWTGAELTEPLGEAVRWLSGQQRPSGSMGKSSLETALAVIALGEAGELSLPVAGDAAAWLIRGQRWDGLWPGAPIFLCPYPDGSMRAFEAPMLSAAAALAALEAVRCEVVGQT